MSKSIFIADDNPELLRTLGFALGRQPGWEVCGVASSGGDAVDKACECHPDLIILDQSMPEMNGLEAMEAIRRTLPDVPVIIFSAHLTRFLEAQAIAAGANAMIEKGESLSVLVSTVRGLIDSGTHRVPPPHLTT
jgi:two-component system, NarL family, response regulator NreC